MLPLPSPDEEDFSLITPMHFDDDTITIRCATIRDVYLYIRAAANKTAVVKQCKTRAVDNYKNATISGTLTL